MEYTITCAGVPIAVASITALSGLVHARIRPLASYTSVREHAVRAGEMLGPARRLWRAIDGDFADAFARTWTGGRLALLDSLDVELAVASVMLVECSRGVAAGSLVVVDARPDMARFGALLPPTDRGGGGRSRSAA